MSESPDRDLASIENLRTEIEEVYRANETMAAQRDMVCQANERITGDYDNLLREFENQKQQVSQLESEAGDARLELSKVRSEHVREAQQANSRVAELVGAAATHQRAAAEFEQVCSQQRQQSENLELENAALKSRLDAARESEFLLRHQLAAGESALDLQKRKMGKAVAAVAKLQAELELRASQLSKSESSLAEAHAMLSRILSDLEQEGSKAGRERAELHSRLRSLDAGLRDAEGRIEQQAAQIEQLRESELTFQESGRQQNKSAEEREIELTAARQTMVSLRHESAQQAEQIAQLTLQLKKSQAAERSAAANQQASADEDRAESKISRKTKKSVKRRGDDLTRIAGIGPGTRQLLAEKRITTFNKLATTKVARLERILRSAGPSLRRYDPSSWPEQARLASEERWFELTMMQKQLERRNALTVEE
jgi:predicted flap endonuclease-1-like 5' DNA nuclease